MAGIQQRIKTEMQKHSDGKLLKGEEVVGWLGEIYGKYLLGGTLVGDECEHDFVVDDMRVSVKTRKASIDTTSTGWCLTGRISKKSGKGCPTHLLFVRLDEKFRLFQVWLYPWKEITARIKKKVVRGTDQGYIFRVRPNRDDEYLIYSRLPPSK